MPAIINDLNQNRDWTGEQLLEGKRLLGLIREGKTRSDLSALGYGTDSIGQWFFEGNLVHSPLLRNEPFPNAERPAAAVAAKK